VLRRYAISPTVNSIYSSISSDNTLNQGQNVKMSDNWTFVLYKNIVNSQKNLKIPKIFFQNLDSPPGQGYYVYMSNCRTNKKRLLGAPEAERPSIEAKGEFNERVQKFSGMA
jgi:hypothetical protein